MKRFNILEIDIFDFFLYICCFYPITTLLFEGTIINKCLFICLIASYLLIILKKGVTKITLVYLIVLIGNYAFVLLITSWSLTSNINMLFYYPFMICYSRLFIDNQNDILKVLLRNKRFILAIIRCWTILVGVSIFIPSCYYVREGGAYYFGSFAGGIFRLAPSALFVMSLTLLSMALFHRKKDIFYMIVPLYCFFMGSSRTYLVVGICVFIVAWYWYIGSARNFYKTVLPLAIIGIIIIINSSLGDKIRYTFDDNQYGDFWFRITSSRSVLWAEDLNGWYSSSFLNRLFGCGLFYTEQLTGLWAHNDFIEILCGFGLVGLIEYCMVQAALIRKFIGKSYNVPPILTFFVIMCWFFNAFFNMYYTYFCSLLSYPFILIAVNYFYCNLKTERDQYSRQKYFNRLRYV